MKEELFIILWPLDTYNMKTLSLNSQTRNISEVEFHLRRAWSGGDAMSVQIWHHFPETEHIEASRIKSLA